MRSRRIRHFVSTTGVAAPENPHEAADRQQPGGDNCRPHQDLSQPHAPLNFDDPLLRVPKSSQLVHGFRNAQDRSGETRRCTRSSVADGTRQPLVVHLAQMWVCLGGGTQPLRALTLRKLEWQVKGLVATPSDDAAGEWEVVAARPHDRGSPAEGFEESVLVHGAEDEARRVFSDEVASASDRGYQSVRLRCKGKDVDSWPPATGWTS
jgi:hypothetical protein